MWNWILLSHSQSKQIFDSYYPLVEFTIPFPVVSQYPTFVLASINLLQSQRSLSMVYHKSVHLYTWIWINFLLFSKFNSRDNKAFYCHKCEIRFRQFNDCNAKKKQKHGQFTPPGNSLLFQELIFGSWEGVHATQLNVDGRQIIKSK